MDNYVWVLTETDGKIFYPVKLFTTEEFARNRMRKEYAWDLVDYKNNGIVSSNLSSDYAFIIFEDKTVIEYKIRCVKIDEFAE